MLEAQKPTAKKPAILVGEEIILIMATYKLVFLVAWEFPAFEKDQKGEQIFINLKRSFLAVTNCISFFT